MKIVNTHTSIQDGHLIHTKKVHTHTIMKTVSQAHTCAIVIQTVRWPSYTDGPLKRVCVCECVSVCSRDIEREFVCVCLCVFVCVRSSYRPFHAKERIHP